ncbi:MAG: hypothetical protein ACLQVL_19830 [Terriglobia bacterium]
MTPPTPQELMHRLAFSADMLEAIAEGLRANAASLPDTRAKDRIAETCDDLAAISCVHRLLSQGIERNSKKGPQTAAIGSKKPTPEGHQPCVTG